MGKMKAVEDVPTYFLSRFNQNFLARMVAGRAPSAPAHSSFIIHVRTNCEATYAEVACFHASLLFLAQRTTSYQLSDCRLRDIQR
ncbi:hypothetical protein I7I48_02439 [Histoplasma ohiense]|nr:hypothetical protein I7I48_02439 [Histoplasma ohiense (nom. inval.)]